MCHHDQIKWNELSNSGYNEPYKFFRGEQTCNNKACTSWGAHLNVTYYQLLQTFYKSKLSSKLKLKNKKESVHGDAKENIVFLPRYGFCKEITNYDPNQELVLANGNSKTKMVIYVTDSAYQSYFSRDFGSHEGDAIIITPKTKLFIDVKLRVRSTCQTDDIVVGQDDFKSCVDEAVQKEFKPSLHCVPPWLSTNNQCTEILDGYINETVPKFGVEFIKTVLTGRETKIETNCRKFCHTTISTVKIRGNWTINNDWKIGLANIVFDKNVLVTEEENSLDLGDHSQSPPCCKDPLASRQK